MIHGKSGDITLATIPYHHKDTTLRLHRAILNAHLILTTNVAATSRYLKRLEDGVVSEDSSGEHAVTVVGQSLVEQR